MRAEWIAAAVVSALSMSPMQGGAPASPATNANLLLEEREEGIPLGEFLELGQEVLGFAMFYEPLDIDGVTVHFKGSISIKQEEFLPFFENVLAEVDFIHLELGAGGLEHHSIRKVTPARGRSGAFKTMARIVSNEELQRLANRSTLVTTFVELQNIPARETVATLQPYFSDNFIENIRNIEGTNIIIMTGKAKSIAQLVKMAEEIDARALQVPTQPGRRPGSGR